MIRSRLIGVAKLGVITLGLGGAAVGGVLAKRSKSSAVSVPRESVLVIGEAPRWTQAPAVGDVETHGEDAIGYPRFAGVPVGQGPQRGGGELGFDDEGWEGDPWAEPAAIGGPLDRGIERPMLPGEWSGFEPGCGGGECDGGAG